jgi:hypothetical protein
MVKGVANRRVSVAIRRPVYLSWYRPVGEAQLGRDQLYRTRQVLDRQGSLMYVYKYQLATQVE